MAPEPDVEEIRRRLSGLADGLRPPAAGADPVLWAAASALDTADLLLTTYLRHTVSRPVDYRQGLLEALGSARAAVGAATHALRENRGGR